MGCYKNYFYLYVLELTAGKYYVGVTRNVGKRFAEHCQGQGARWTNIYKPRKVVYTEQLPYYSYAKAQVLEDVKTIEMMKKYGRANVRGGVYCSVNQKHVDDLLGVTLCSEIKRDSLNSYVSPSFNKAVKKQKQWVNYYQL